MVEDVDKLAGIQNSNKSLLEQDETDIPNEYKRQTMKNYWFISHQITANSAKIHLFPIKTVACSSL